MVCLSNLIIALDVFHLSHLQFLPKATFFCVFGVHALAALHQLRFCVCLKLCKLNLHFFGVGDHPTRPCVDNGVRGGL